MTFTAYGAIRFGVVSPNTPLPSRQNPHKHRLKIPYFIRAFARYNIGLLTRHSNSIDGPES